MVAMLLPDGKPSECLISLTANSYFFATLIMVVSGAFATNGLQEWAPTTIEILAILYAVSI
jgi:hypothetical protein